MKNKKILELAKQFSQIIKNHVGDYIHDINKMNNIREFQDACASHEFLDANECMLDAWDALYPNDDMFSNLELINDAWSKARSNRFFVPKS